MTNLSKWSRAASVSDTCSMHCNSYLKQYISGLNLNNLKGFNLVSIWVFIFIFMRVNENLEDLVVA